MSRGKAAFWLASLLSSVILIVVGVLVTRSDVATHTVFDFASLIISLTALLASYALNKIGRDSYTYALFTVAIPTSSLLFMHIIAEIGLLGSMGLSPAHDHSLGMQIWVLIRILQFAVIVGFILLDLKKKPLWPLLVSGALATLVGAFMITTGNFPVLFISSGSPSAFTLVYAGAFISSCILLLIFMLTRGILRGYFWGFAAAMLLLITSETLFVLNGNDFQSKYHAAESMLSMFAYGFILVSFMLPYVKKIIELENFPFSDDRNTFMNAITHPSFITDTEGTLLSANTAMADWLDTDPFRIVGQKLSNVLPDDAPLLESMAKEALLDGKQVNAEPVIRHGRNIEYSLYPMALRGGKQKRLAYIGWDLTREARVDELLRLSEAQYRSLVESMPFFVLTLDAKFNVTYMNSTMVRMLRLNDASQSIGKPFKELIAAKHYEKVLALSCKLTPTEQLSSEVLEVGSGPQKAWHSWVMRLFLDRERTVGYICIGQDITELRKTASEIALSEERFRSLFEDNYLPMLVVNPLGGGILQANAVAERFYGLPEGDLCMMTVSQLDLQSGFSMGIAEVEALRDRGVSSISSRHRAAGGVARDVELFVNILNYVDREVLSLTIHDITDRKAAEEALDRERAYLDNLFESGPDAVVILNSNTLVLRANMAFRKMFRYQPDEIIGRRLIDLVSLPNRQDEILANIEACSRGTRIDTISPRQRKDGTEVPCRIIGIPIRLDDGITNVYFIYHDLTELAHSQERLTLANEVVKESPVVLFKWANKPGWPIEYVSENISRWGYDAMELTKTSKCFIDLVHEDDRQKLKLEVEGYQAKALDEYSLEYRVLHADGSFIWVEDNTRITRRPDRKVQGIQGVVIDITAAKHAYFEKQQSLEDLRDAWEKTIDVLSSVTEFKDPYTAGHQKGVAKLAKEIAIELGLSQDIVEAVEKAALVHDIGKIQLPADILGKPRALTPIEIRLVKTHSKAGRDILSHIKLPWPLAEIVMQHHERLDGTGYPSGLKGDEILPEAMIIAVSDIVEAMTSYRPYRPAWPVQAALAEILRLRGTALDSKVVDACLNLYERKGFSLKQQGDPQ